MTLEMKNALEYSLGETVTVAISGGPMGLSLTITGILYTAQVQPVKRSIHNTNFTVETGKAKLRFNAADVEAYHRECNTIQLRALRA